MKAKAEALLPCPFCGSCDISIKTRKTTIVECDACSALFIRRSEDAAVRAWNTRVFKGAVCMSSDELESIKGRTHR